MWELKNKILTLRKTEKSNRPEDKMERSQAGDSGQPYCSEQGDGGWAWVQASTESEGWLSHSSPVSLINEIEFRVLGMEAGLVVGGGKLWKVSNAWEQKLNQVQDDLRQCHNGDQHRTGCPVSRTDNLSKKMKSTTAPKMKSYILPELHYCGLMFVSENSIVGNIIPKFVS